MELDAGATPQARVAKVNLDKDTTQALRAKIIGRLMLLRRLSRGHGFLTAGDLARDLGENRDRVREALFALQLRLSTNVWWTLHTDKLGWERHYRLIKRRTPHLDVE